jgi:hypothetical protein
MRYPAPYARISEEHRRTRAKLSSDLCAIQYDDGRKLFVRGVLYIPIHHHPTPLGLGCWASQSGEDFERYVRSEVARQRAEQDPTTIVPELEPTLGRLANSFAHYPGAEENPAVRLHWSRGKERPRFEIESADHPLALDQQKGISLARAWEIVHACLPELR